jgi:hypothetical protein
VRSTGKSEQNKYDPKAPKMVQEKLNFLIFFLGQHSRHPKNQYSNMGFSTVDKNGLDKFNVELAV